MVFTVVHVKWDRQFYNCGVEGTERFGQVLLQTWGNCIKNSFT
jgi:hypothetical protein